MLTHTTVVSADRQTHHFLFSFQDTSKQNEYQPSLLEKSASLVRALAVPV
jgi:hypothetical protein